MEPIEINGEIVWKQIPSFPDYEASSVGIIRRISDMLTLSMHVNRRYKTVRVKNSQGITTRGIHRLVCEAFHGKRPSSIHQAAHWDGVRDNNTPDNLRWATPLENNRDKIRHGTNRGGALPGEKNYKAKLTKDQALEIFNFSGRRKDISAKYGVSLITISDIWRKKSWKHLHTEKIYPPLLIVKKLRN